MAELHQIRRNHAIKRAKPNDDKVWFSTDTGTPPTDRSGDQPAESK